MGSRFHASLDVDDLQVAYYLTNLQTIDLHMQTCLDKTTIWATQNGFKFSTSKRKVGHFKINVFLNNVPGFILCNNILPYTDTMKFLGLTWYKKLTWRPHINKLRVECNKLVGILLSIAKNEWGADQVALMRIYRALILSKID